MRKATAAGVLVLGFLVAATAQSVQRGLYHSQNLGLSYNAVGLLVDSRLFYRWPLVKKEGMLWESTRIDLGGRNELTPTDELLAACVTVVPIAFLEVTLKGGPYIMYRQLGFGFCELDSADAPYDYDTMDDAQRLTRIGYWLTVNPSVKLKFGPVVIVDALNVDFYGMGEGNYFLERRTYSLRKMRDTDLINDTYLFFQPNEKFMLGAVYRYLYVVGTMHASQRLSGAVVLTPNFKSFHRSYGVLVVGVYLQDRVFRAKPYIGLRVGVDMKVGRRGPDARDTL